MDFAICPRCDATNPAAASHCQSCGADLSEPPAPPAAAPDPVPAPPPRAPVANTPQLPPDLAARAAELEAQIARNPGARALYMRLAQLHLDAGHKELAIETYERLLQADPKNAAARHRLNQLTGVAPPPLPAALRPSPAPAPARGRRPVRSRGRLLWGAVAAVALLALAALGMRYLFPDARLVLGGEDSVREPRFSPRGDRLAFLAERAGHLALSVRDLRGGAVKELAQIEGGWGGRTYAWSPDGRKIAYSSDAPGEDEYGSWVFVVDVEGGQPTAVARGREPSWSPDSLTLALECAPEFGTEEGLGAVPGGPCLVGVVGGAPRRLPAPEGARVGFSPSRPLLLFEVVDYDQPTAAADASGESAVLQAPGEELGDLAVAAQQGGMPQNMLGASAGLARELEARQLDARRSGSAGGAGGLGASDVYLMDVSGGSPSNLTRDGRSSSPAWSMDGGRILFVRHQENTGAAELWVMNADGSEQRPALSKALAVQDPSHLALLADGRVLFTAAVENAGQSLSQALAGGTSADLHVASVGGEARRLENRHPFKQRFSVSPDGRFVAYEAVNDKGKGEIWLLTP
jgi:hypothetical protein